VSTTEATERCIGRAAIRDACRVGCLLIALLLAPRSIAAQAPAANVELPTMVLKVCPKLEDARAQADLSSQFAKAVGPMVIEPRYVWKGCNSLPVIARLRSREESIEPLVTWAVTYDPNSSTTVDARHAGIPHKVPYALRKQRVTFFVADFMVPADADDDRIGPEDRGKWFTGWVEVPDEPYLSKYLEAERRNR
jgi:hypothetical protein